MKKLIYIFALALLATSCEKAVLKRTTVKIVAKDANVSVDFTNDGKKYLDLPNDELTRIFVTSLSDELGKGKIDIVTENPDYIIEVGNIHMREYVVSEYVESNWVDLSRINIVAEYTLTESLVDVPELHRIESKVEEKLDTKNKKGEWKHKGNQANVAGFGGTAGAMEDHGKEVRKTFKKLFKNNQ